MLQAMISRSGRSGLSVARELGHGQTWAYNSTRPGRDPKLSTVAAVASVTGYEVAIVDSGTGETVATVEPPEPKGSE